MIIDPRAFYDSPYADLYANPRANHLSITALSIYNYIHLSIASFFFLFFTTHLAAAAEESFLLRLRNAFGTRRA